MYDTIEAVIVPGRKLVDTMWSHEGDVSSPRGRITKRWYNSRDNTLRLNYYARDVPDDHGLLKIAFNVPAVVGLSGRENVSDDDRDSAFSRVNAWLNKHFGALPDVRDWRCQRIDYAYNFTLGHRLPSYLLALQSLNVPVMAQTIYPGSGVTWRTHGKHGRAVTFYDKDAKIGDGLRDGVLRFEVQNGKTVVAYMARKWFGCDRTVGQMARAGRALYVLARSWQRLGLDVDKSYHHESELRSRLRDTYGVSAAAAFSALDVITKYGKTSIMLGYISQNNYYHWRRKLRRDGFLASFSDVLIDGGALVSLHLPARDVIASLVAQNLGTSGGGSLSFLLKNRWEKLASVLGVLPTATPSDYLLGFYDDE